MVSAWTRDRARSAIENLSQARLDWPDFSEQVAGQLRRSVGFDGWGLAQTDPASLLPARAVTQDAPVCGSQQRFWRIENQLSDVNQLASLACSGRPVGALSVATGGDLARSRRWAEILRPAGVIDELRAALTIGGYCWGSLTLYRASGCRYTDEEIGHVSEILGAAAAGARGTWASRSPARDADPCDDPGTIIVTAAGTPVTATPQASRWLARLIPDPRGSQGLIYALTARLTAPATGKHTAAGARVRARTDGGHWLDIHASRLAAALPGCDVAITIQPASADRLSPLLMRAHALSARERQVAWLILDSRAPAEIARALHISPYTANDHLKAIFRKTRTHSQPELSQCLTGRI